MAKSGRELTLRTGSALSATAARCFVAAVEARCPPAEKPITPMRFGAIEYLAAFARTYCRAR